MSMHAWHASGTAPAISLQSCITFSAYGRKAGPVCAAYKPTACSAAAFSSTMPVRTCDRLAPAPSSPSESLPVAARSPRMPASTCARTHEPSLEPVRVPVVKADAVDA